MVKYCFIANYFLTPLQLRIAEKLKDQGIDSCWVVVNDQLHQSIRAAGWSEQNILRIRLTDRAEPELLPPAFPLKLHDFLTADRALREAPELGMTYLLQATSALVGFLAVQKPRFVFGESTWAHERIAAAICRHRGDMTYLWPHTVRIPSERWGFFVGGDQADLYAPPAITQTKAAIRVLDIVQPAYVHRNDILLSDAQTFRARLLRVKRFLTRENISSTDPTNIQSRYATFKIAGAEELNRLLYRFVDRASIDQALLDRPFVLYALHKQPESSIDVLGRYYEDQWRVIHAIWRTLPTGWKLYVKEHSNAIGDRSLGFYRRITALPNTVIVHEKASAQTLIKASRAVFTVSGTIAYEAALMGKNSFTFAPMFFNRLNHCRAITTDTLRNCSDLRDIIDGANPAAISDAERYIHSRSFEGTFTDAYTDPTALLPDNISKLASAFSCLSQG